MSIVTLEELKAHLRYDDGDSDLILSCYLGAAESAVLNYITDEFADGDYPDNVKQAVLLLVGMFDDNRNAEFAPNGHYMPFAVKWLLYDNRNPTVV